MRIIQRVFRKVFGKACWGADQGYSSMLMLEFGKPHLRVLEPNEARAPVSVRVRKLLSRRRVRLRGDWRLTIYGCNWSISSQTAKIADSRSSRAKIRKATTILNGQALTRIYGEALRGKWVFEFDLGASLETRRFDRAAEQWILREPSGYTFSVRGDGKYTYNPPGTIIQDARWRVLRGLVLLSGTQSPHKKGQRGA